MDRVFLFLVLCLVGGVAGGAVLHAASPSFSQGGFTHMGALPGRGSAKQINYFISPYQRTQAEALIECHEIYSGRLVTIYTQEQDFFIRDRLSSMGLTNEQIHTAGRYNPVNGEWEWLTTGTPLYYRGWAIWAGQPENESVNATVQLLGESSSYGWFSRVAYNPHRFICEINI